MTSFTWIVCMLTTLILGAFHSTQAATLDISHWSHMAPLSTVSSETQGAVKFSLSPKIMDLSSPGLDDLRLVREPDTEVGYYLHQSTGTSRKVILKARLFNRSYVPGTQCSATVDFEGNYLKNLIAIKTTGTNFLRKVRLESSNDQYDWQIVRDNAFLFRTQESGGRVYEKTSISFPENNQRYLRVTVFAGSGDTGAMEIEDVEVWQDKKTSPETADVPVVSAKTEQKNKVTEISLDLGFRNMPLCDLELAFGDRNFYREVEVFGRNSLVQTVRTKVEDAPKLEKTIPVPWQRISGGRIYRLSAGNSVDESLALPLKGAKYRYLLIKIMNYDDPPLKFSGANVTRYSLEILFAPKRLGGYTLYFGNSKARQPKYDVGSYIGRLQREGVSTVTVGDVVPNPAFKPVARTIPWSERYAGIIWVALLAMLAALGLLIYRVARSGPKPEGPKCD